MNKEKEFLNYLEVEKRYSINTIKAYQRDLNYYFNYLNSEQIEKINEQVIKNYLAQLYINKASKKTIARKLSTIKSYYKFLIKKHKFNFDFINNIKAPKKDKLLPNVIYKDELQKILNYMPTGNFCYRNKAILTLLYSSGVRVSELCDITLSSIDLENRYIIVTGKGNKTRICPFSMHCKNVLEEYISKERNIKVKSDCNYLFINKFGDKITPRSIENIVNDISFKLFGNKKLHPHIFRHTYATNLLNNGADLRIIQELLGHSSLMTTQIYTHLANEEINNIYKISHPRSESN